MKVFDAGATAQQIDAAATKFPGAGTRQQKINAAQFNQPLNLIEKRGKTLDFINNNALNRRADLFRCHPGRDAGQGVKGGTSGKVAMGEGADLEREA